MDKNIEEPLLGSSFTFKSKGKSSLGMIDESAEFNTAINNTSLPDGSTKRRKTLITEEDSDGDVNIGNMNESPIRVK